jgi:hypothetical protein
MGFVNGKLPGLMNLMGEGYSIHTPLTIKSRQTATGALFQAFFFPR